MRTFNVVLACVSVLLLSNPAFANSSAKFKKIEREFKQCESEMTAAFLYNVCLSAAVEDYEKAFNKSQKTQFKKRKNACIAKFGNPESGYANGSMSTLEVGSAWECMHKAAKSIAKVKR